MKSLRRISRNYFRLGPGGFLRQKRCVISIDTGTEQRRSGSGSGGGGGNDHGDNGGCL